MMIKVDENIVRSAVYGGAFYGGGGGGDIPTGLKYGMLAIQLGDVYIVDVDTVAKKSDSYILTASMVGAPSARERHVTPAHILRSAQLLIEKNGLEVAGFITAENGGFSSVNGWISSALLGIPIVDAPADGRAHPTGVMGSMGLHRQKDYVSVQSAVGGSLEKGTYVELVAKGCLEKVDKIVREASVQAGGLVSVTRNPVQPSYIRENAAVGALSKAVELGKIYLRDIEADEKIRLLAQESSGQIIDAAEVRKVNLRSVGGYDVGSAILKGETNIYELTFFNEYMTLEDSAGRRLATFPDLITTLDLKTAFPVATAELREGIKLVIVKVSKTNVPLGSGVKDPDLLRQVETIVNKRMLDYISTNAEYG